MSKGVPVTSVGNLDNYGLMTGLDDEDDRNETLERFKEMYAPAVGTGAVMDYLSETGLGVLDGAHILKKVPGMYKSEVEYGGNEIARGLKDVARVHLADVGTRIFYTNHNNYDTHSNQAPTHTTLLGDLSRAIMDFYQDLEDHGKADNVAMLVFTEFGRRVADNGSGTGPWGRRRRVPDREQGQRRPLRRVSLFGSDRSDRRRRHAAHVRLSWNVRFDSRPVDGR